MLVVSVGYQKYQDGKIFATKGATPVSTIPAVNGNMFKQNVF
jgi:hypothetical protein